MGLRKVFLSNDKHGFIQYTIDTIKLEGIVYVNDAQFNLRVYKDDKNNEKWFKNLNIPSDDYWNHLTKALKTTSLGDEQNQFVLDGESIIWKQVFACKNLTGKKGKFPLEKLDSPNSLHKVLDALANEMDTKDLVISQLTSENESLMKEMKEATSIAEKAVQLKEQFEEEIYGKFAEILNAKKQQIHLCDDDRDNSIYEEDTDIDEDIERRPRPVKKSRNSEIPMNSEESFNLSQSQDFFSKALEADLQMDFS